MDVKERKDCGYAGISVKDCKYKGCCFDAKYPGVPWCFYPLLKKGADECAMDSMERKNCGYSGISVKDCTSKGCCFDAKYPGVPWCFYPHLKKGNIPL
ncbi:Trefoil factor 2 [Chelonia mydas]|uniref:Trefoil factor 2 n=1 Tax=Chelonia mydas TaxID=8469 RepID=M7BHA8_CHEMY|nr:Trefoil factor 2 [Chelonia mydas]